jgi:TIR domain
MPKSSKRQKHSRYKVIISSTQKDRDLARDLARRLKDAGVHTTYSELTRSAGSDYEKTFMGLSSADEIIVILSSNSLDNFWMMFEIGAAYSLRKKITPVVVGLERQELPPVIKQLKYINYDKLYDYIANIERCAQAA